MKTMFYEDRVIRGGQDFPWIFPLARRMQGAAFQSSARCDTLPPMKAFFRYPVAYFVECFWRGTFSRVLGIVNFIFLILAVANVQPVLPRWVPLLLAWQIAQFYAWFKLERERQPQLEIVSGEESPFVQLAEPTMRFMVLGRPPEPPEPPAHKRRLLRIEVKNKSTRTVRNVQVKLERLTPSKLICLPAALHMMNDNNPPYKAHFDLDAKAPMYMDVATDCESQIEIHHIVTGVETLIPDGQYQLLLVARGQDVPACKKELILDRDDQGDLHLRPKS
jgi:hypothetical protein